MLLYVVDTESPNVVAFCEAHFACEPVNLNILQGTITSKSKLKSTDLSIN